MSIGEDPGNFYGHDLISEIKKLVLANGDFINGHIWGIIALEAYGAEYDRSAALKYLDSEQKKDGGFAFLSGMPSSDELPDLTAMAVYAMAMTGRDKEHPVVKKSLNFIKESLSKMEKNPSKQSVESLDQILMALVAVKEDLNQYKFKDKLLVDEILGYVDADRSFKHTKDGKSNHMANQQTLIALNFYKYNRNLFDSLKNKPIIIDAKGAVFGSDRSENPKVVENDLKVTADNVTIKNTIINGILTLNPGDSGSVNIENVKAQSIKIPSGGVNSIHFSNVNADNLFIDTKKAVRIENKGITNLKNTLVSSDAILENISGSFGNIKITGVGIRNIQLKGKFEAPILMEAQGTIKTLSDTTVSLLKVSVANEGNVSIDGSFEKIEINKASKVDIVKGSAVKEIIANAASIINIDKSATVLKIDKVNKDVKINSNTGNNNSSNVSDNSKTFELRITHSGNTVFSRRLAVVEGKSAMKYLKEIAVVVENQGPGFINGINGVINKTVNELTREQRERGILGMDWFIYLNGSKTPTGAEGVYLKPGDILVFDYREWDWRDLVAPDYTGGLPINLKGVPTEIEQGKAFRIRASCISWGIYNAVVRLDGVQIGTTDIDGYCDVVINTPGEHIVSVEKDGGKNEKKVIVKAVQSIPVIIPVTGIKLNTTECSINVGESIELKAIIEPENATNKKVIWNCENSEIASVDENGKVTGKKEGQTKIIVSTEDGKKKASCTIQVKEEAKDYNKIIQDTIEETANKIISYNSFGEWEVFVLKRIGKEIPYDYLAEVKEDIKNGNYNNSSATQYEKMTLAVLASKGDPTNIEGFNIIEKIYNHNMNQGINAYVFGLIALDAGGYNVPEGAKWDREKLINEILDERTNDGGWSYGGTTADPDMTAMALSALAPYYNKRKDVKEAIDNAVELLSRMQTEKGGYNSWGTENSNSIAMVIVGLSCCNIDVVNDVRFIKNGKNMIDALLSYRTADGGFGYNNNENYNGMATEQSLRALVAYKRFVEGKGSIYVFDKALDQITWIKDIALYNKAA
ncbi:MAG: Ig-like domain-containing protein [Caloramator sp.]|nr:Ig-like domain-containing protein [Caloramator sp.]